MLSTIGIVLFVFGVVWLFSSFLSVMRNKEHVAFVLPLAILITGLLLVLYSVSG
jgi:hypothetical protein